MSPNRQTDGRTDGRTTVTLAAHARRGLITQKECANLRRTRFNYARSALYNERPTVNLVSPKYTKVNSNIVSRKRHSRSLALQPATAMSMDSVPKDLRGLRACKLCSMVKVSVHTFYTTI